jgi:hypothetical protein
MEQEEKPKIILVVGSSIKDTCLIKTLHQLKVAGNNLAVAFLNETEGSAIPPERSWSDLPLCNTFIQQKPLYPSREKQRYQRHFKKKRK